LSPKDLTIYVFIRPHLVHPGGARHKSNKKQKRGIHWSLCLLFYLLIYNTDVDCELYLSFQIDCHHAFKET
jgi:hypothetical protein